LEQLIKLFEELQKPLGLWQALIPITFSLIASVITYLMYQFFYGSRHIGAGVHRTFLLGGPAITTLFLGIQTSIPLSLGLLGALSFVRFRTPVKDPAEIGFLLLLIASSILSATKNYLVTVLLFAVAFLALGLQWLATNRLAFLGCSNLIITVDQSAFPGLDTRINAFLKEKLTDLQMQTMSVVDNRVSLHYQFRRKAGFDGTVFTDELDKVTDHAKIEVFIS
jgi:hypothetical protein